MLAAGMFAFALILLLGGIRSLRSSLKSISGSYFHRLLKYYTTNTLQAFSLGLLATIILQSSSAVSVIVIGFINGGFLTLRQGLCIIIGANVGTTITSQFFSLELRSVLVPVLMTGVLLYLGEVFYKRKLGGGVLLGISAMLAGIELLVFTFEPLTFTPLFQEIYMFSRGEPWRGILVGSFAAALLQSSSVIAGMVVLMAREKIMNLPEALAVVLGADLGTCFTSLLASIGTALPAKRLALGHIAFNFFSIMLVLPLWPYFISFIDFIAVDPGRQVANAHFFYNLLGAIVLLPLVDIYVKYFFKKDNTLYLKKIKI